MLLSDASNKYAPVECPEGLEIIITLRFANISSTQSSSSFVPSDSTAIEADDSVTVPFCGAGNSNPSSDYVEIQMGDLCVSINEPGLGADFFTQFFREDNPVSDSARLSLIRDFPHILNPSSNDSLFSMDHRDTSNNTIDNMNRMKQSQQIPQLDSHEHNTAASDFAKFLSIAKTTIRYVFSKRWRGRSSLSPSSSSFATVSQSGVVGFAAHINQRWQVNFHHLLLKKQHFYKLNSVETACTVFIVLYFALLILLSLPPALLRKGIQKGVQLKKKCDTAFQRTLSKTQSLAKLARPASADMKMMIFNVQVK